MRVLVIEDHQRLANLIVEGLASFGIGADTFPNAEDGLAAALYEKGRVAESLAEWARAAMYYAAARRHHDTPASAWAAGLAEARAVIPSVRASR